MIKERIVESDVCEYGQKFESTFDLWLLSYSLVIFYCKNINNILI